MGNFSRNTFQPEKGYVGVRLQQGVPLVDADWNELNDVVRQELYNGLGMLSSGISAPNSSNFGFVVLAGFFNLPVNPNDFYVFPGQALVGGRPLNMPLTSTADVIRYTTQPWVNPARASQDGVAVIPPLTTPATNRTDLVYLDVWEREVNSAEDSNLINPVIGVETCVRLKREVAIRVVEGGTSIPAAPVGHTFMPLALLNRLAGQAQIASDQIRDIRPRIGSSGTHQVSLPPVFLPISTTTQNWDFFPLFFAFTSLSYKAPDKSVFGVMPLVLPDRVRLASMTVHGYTRSIIETPPSPREILISLWRTPYNAQIQSGGFSNFGESLISGTNSSFSITHTGNGIQLRAFNRTITINANNDINIVDNSRYSYMLSANASSNDFEAFISGIVLNYQY
jgi:hypothetical protein